MMGMLILYFFAAIGAVFFFAIVFKLIFDGAIENVKEEEDEWTDSES